MKVIRKDTGESITVRKYIIDSETGEESIWSNDWSGRHIIGKDCEFSNLGAEELINADKVDEVSLEIYRNFFTPEDDSEMWEIAFRYGVKYASQAQGSKQLYSLNCDKCGEVYMSIEAFHDPQLCHGCNAIEGLKSLASLNIK